MAVETPLPYILPQATLSQPVSLQPLLALLVGLPDINEVITPSEVTAV